ncbi:MAG TPA: GNAT family N-acetyltransferase [Ktedonobacterales bacterium]|nr:GNAT family N-acetyltransferase [Ktedonobacterales bacterium]
MDMPAFQTAIPTFEELQGARVLVRPYRASDADDIYAAIEASRDHLRPWLPFADETADELRDWLTHALARWLLREELTVGVWELASGRYLGGSGFHIHSWQIGYFEIGYWLRADAEGKGFMTETVRLLTDYAFASLGAQRVEIRCDARNTRSAAVAERLGFVREARLRKNLRAPDGTLRDTLIFARTPDDPPMPA